MTKQEINNVIEELHALGYYSTAGKEPGELVQQLALLRIDIENRNNVWFP